MKRLFWTKLTAALLCVLMLTGSASMVVLAVEYTEKDSHYLKMISKRDWDLAPGVAESEIVLSKEDGSQRQVCHVVEVDPYNPYTKVMPSYHKMKEGLDNKNYATQVMSEQAKYAEEHGYGNVVAAMNTALHWYDTDYYKKHPELIGEPLGTLIMDGKYYRNSQNSYFGAYTCLVINFDEKDGQPRPAHIPKTEVRQTYDAITGWEEQLIPASFHFLVKNGVNEHVINDPEPAAPRSILGIKADGTIVIVMNEGRQEPFSRGFNCYEMAEFMISLGCVQAVNCDGGGSSTFLSQRPGEELEMHCSPSDGVERATAHGILVISTAPAEGEFVKADVSADADYYTPGSTVRFNAKGMDLDGVPADIPANAVWQLTDPSMGTVSDGVFVSSGKEGAVTVQLFVDGKTVGEDTVYIVRPDSLSFLSDALAVPYGEKYKITLNAAYQGHSVVLQDGEVTFSLSDPFIGSIDGAYFTAGAENTAPDSAILTAAAYGLTAKVTVTLGRGSNLLCTFEDETEEFGIPDGWSVSPAVGNAKGSIHLIKRSSGQVKQGDYALAVVCDFSQITGTGTHAVTVNMPTIDCTGATALGIWVYVPFDARHARLEFGGGGVDLYGLTEGFHYLSVPVNGANVSTLRISVSQSLPDEPNLNGKFTLYIDDITLDYSNAAADRYAPVFSAPAVVDPSNGASRLMQGQTVGFNKLTFEAPVFDNASVPNASGIAANTAQVFVDGVEVSCVYRAGKIVASDVMLADGFHTVEFRIKDNKENTARISASIYVQGGSSAPTVTVTPRDPHADRLLIGSLYWLDVTATQLETVEQIKLVFDLNNASSWEFEGMTLAEGFTATYAIKADDNIATVIISRTGDNKTVGNAALASIPVRTWVYEPAKTTPADLVKYGVLWAQSIEITLETGEITFTDAYKGSALGAFGMENILVDTELFFNGSHRNSVTGAQAWINACVSAGVGFHEHTLGSPSTQSPTATRPGYTGRVFCTSCGSAVEWGTPLSAVGHEYNVVGNQLVCDCGEVYEGTGLQIVGDKAYYMMGGKLLNGWQTVGDDWYYFDKTTYAGLDGEKVADQGVAFVFEQGRLTSGRWVKTSAGIRYWYGPGYYKGGTVAMTWYTINGKDYCIDKQGYAATGTRWIMDDNTGNGKCTWYVFDENGVCHGRYLHTGLVEWGGNHYYLIDGVSKYGMYLVDGAYYYFYFTNNFAARRNETFSCTYTNGLLPAGSYTFGADGKMLDKQVYNSAGILYYYEKGNKSQGSGVFTYNGQSYIIEANGKVLFTGVLTDASGQTLNYVNGVYTYVPKNGIVKEGGNLYYYENDVKIQKGLVKDENGDYYYFGLNYYAVKNGTFYFPDNKMNGLLPKGGNFQVGADCKVIIPEPKNGIVKEGSNLYYYENGEKVQKGLVKDENGDYYYFGTKYYAVSNGTFYFPDSKMNGLLPKGGNFQVDADCKVIIP